MEVEGRRWRVGKEIGPGLGREENLPKSCIMPASTALVVGHILRVSAFGHGRNREPQAHICYTMDRFFRL